eukprot:scaffold2045_cov404-Prasinococcus_capsulatus_cf.AAC.20
MSNRKPSGVTSVQARPPASSKASTSSQSSTPRWFNRVAAPRPVGPAPRMSTFTLVLLLPLAVIAKGRLLSEVLQQEGLDTPDHSSPLASPSSLGSGSLLQCRGGHTACLCKLNAGGSGAAE